MKKVLIMTMIAFLAGCSKKNDNQENDSIKLDETEITLTIGDSQQLTYAITPANSSNKELAWNSTNQDVVSVNNRGRISALKEGESIISVEIIETKSHSSCKVIVNSIKVAGISFGESEISIEKGVSYQLNAIINPAESTIKTVKWSSSDTNIADINNDGLLTAKSPGECIIKAKTDDGGFEASCKVVVTPIMIDEITIEGLYLDNPSGSQFPASDYENLLLCHGDRLKIKIGFSPENADNQKLIWNSSDINIATVNNEGVLSITSDIEIKGNVTITAKSEDGEHTAYVVINVDDVHLNAHGLSLNQSGATNTVSFISSITTSIEKSISIGSVYITDGNNSLIQIVSNIQNAYNRTIATSDMIDVSPLGLSGQNLTNALSAWKFVYTYKIQGMNDYASKEVTINASIWSSGI
jgi:uncharacterized protein YjdB